MAKVIDGNASHLIKNVQSLVKTKNIIECDEKCTLLNEKQCIYSDLEDLFYRVVNNTTEYLRTEECKQTFE